MAKIIWSPTALNHIESILDFISKDSPIYASIFVDNLIDKAERLIEFPNSGRIIPEINQENCREIIYYSYRIMYKINPGEIWITGVIHGATDWNPKS